MLAWVAVSHPSEKPNAVHAFGGLIRFSRDMSDSLGNVVHSSGSPVLRNVVQNVVQNVHSSGRPMHCLPRAVNSSGNLTHLGVAIRLSRDLIRF